MAVDAATVHRLQEPATVLAAKQVIGGPDRQGLAAELAQFDAFEDAERQVWQA